MNPWVCPKCGRVWGPLVMECIPCNSKKQAYTTTNEGAFIAKKKPYVADYWGTTCGR